MRVVARGGVGTRQEQPDSKGAHFKSMQGHIKGRPQQKSKMGLNLLPSQSESAKVLAPSVDHGEKVTPPRKKAGRLTCPLPARLLSGPRFQSSKLGHHAETESISLSLISREAARATSIGAGAQGARHWRLWGGGALEPSGGR